MNLNATLFAQFIVFFILGWFTMKFVWPPLIKAIDERAKKISDGLVAAERGKKELADANKVVQEELATSRYENQRRLAEAEKLAQKIVEDAKLKAESEKKQILDRAIEDTERLSQQAKEELREELASLVIKGAEKILQKEIDKQEHSELLNRLKAEL